MRILPRWEDVFADALGCSLEILFLPARHRPVSLLVQRIVPEDVYALSGMMRRLTR